MFFIPLSYICIPIYVFFFNPAFFSNEELRSHGRAVKDNMVKPEVEKWNFSNNNKITVSGEKNFRYKKSYATRWMAPHPPPPVRSHQPRPKTTRTQIIINKPSQTPSFSRAPPLLLLTYHRRSAPSPPLPSPGKQPRAPSLGFLFVFSRCVSWEIRVDVRGRSPASGRPSPPIYLLIRLVRPGSVVGLVMRVGLFGSTPNRALDLTELCSIQWIN